MPAPATKLGYRTTALQALRGADLSGQVAVVTGGSSGIGRETVLALAVAGCDVTFTCRSGAAGQRVAAELAAAPGVRGRISVQALDLADLRSVAAAGAALAATLPRLDLLILSAGVMALKPRATTAQGWEMQASAGWGRREARRHLSSSPPLNCPLTSCPLPPAPLPADGRQPPGPHAPGLPAAAAAA